MKISALVVLILISEKVSCHELEAVKDEAVFQGSQLDWQASQWNFVLIRFDFHLGKCSSNLCSQLCYEVSVRLEREKKIEKCN